MSILLQKMWRLPDSPGVYFFYDKNKNLIYVGKATSLKDRVGSYFKFYDRRRRQLPLTPSWKEGEARMMRPIEEMLHEVADVAWEKTDSALEAAILEGQKIKNLKPKYNIKWRDDKSWNYFLITKDEFPRLIPAREHDLKKVDPEKKYKYIFGPYPGLNMREATKILRRIFYFSDCQPPATDGHRPARIATRSVAGRPCFYRQLSQCLGVCEGVISPADYNKKVIGPLVKFLRGQRKSLARDLKKQMSAASKNKNYEEAARLRDQLSAMDRIQDIALINKSFIVSKDGKPPAAPLSKGGGRIEAYDISNLGKTDKVGSMVVFDEFGPIKYEYRKFNIKTVVGQSDVDCLKEVLARRLNHNEWPLPDMFLIDGGLPQIGAAAQIIRGYGVSRPVIGIAKGPKRTKNQFFVRADTADGKADNTDSDLIRWVKENKNLLIRARDEAHRFAITFQRAKRKIK